MDPADTVQTRLDDIGFDRTVASNPDATIRRTAVVARVARASDAPEPASLRELPRISVELRGTLSDPTTPESSPVLTRDRDLEVLSTLGEGGMGRVFLAHQHSLDRDVAIKTVRDRASDRERAALLSEGAITGHLEHPGVVPVHALGVDEDGRPVLVMKRVEGVEWGTLLDEPDHPLWTSLGGRRADRLDEHLEILMQVCNAAHFAHSRGIVHRDIKPQNVFIGRYGEVYLGDWGLAVRVDGSATSSALCGTPAYMAPEMALGGAIDARTDVYLLGATLHRILTGSARHPAPTVKAAVFSAATSPPYDYGPDVPPELAALANAATSRDPADRPASAAELRQSLADYLRHKGSIALARSAVERLARLRDLVRDGAALARQERHREVDLVAVEARFALRQALEEWPDNAVARQAARELDELLAIRNARAAELERLAGELDPTVARRQRALASGVLAVGGVILSVSAFLVPRPTGTSLGIFYESLVPLGAALVMLVVLRRALLATLVNRRSIFAMFTIIGAVTIDRALGLLAGIDAAQTLMHDCLLTSMIAALAAATLFRWLFWCALVTLAAAVWAAVSPGHAMHAFSLASGISLLVIVPLTLRAGVRDKP